MIKIETIDVFGFEGALRGMRMPFESHEKSDSCNCTDQDCKNCSLLEWGKCTDEFVRDYCLLSIGNKDMELCKKLIRGGSEHRKFLRMIHVQAEVKMPSYFMAELATYKIGTTMNSSSLQHLGSKRDYTIRDFSVDDERIYEILDWKPTDHKEKNPLMYLEDGNTEFKKYECGDRVYRVYKNGRIIREAFDIQDNGMNRTRHFKEKEIIPTQNPCGYWTCNLGGRLYKEKWMVHRLVAMLWHFESYSPNLTVNHIDHQKGNNHADNLEWVTLEDNIRDENEFGLNTKTLHSSYMSFKSSSKLTLEQLFQLKQIYKETQSVSKTAKIMNMSQGQTWSVVNNYNMPQNRELFIQCLIWENLLKEINSLRRAYKETDDYSYFRAMRQIMPQSFVYHVVLDLNYETLLTIYRQRKNHKLNEWHEFCDWLKSLPYMDEFISAMEGK